MALQCFVLFGSMTCISLCIGRKLKILVAPVALDLQAPACQPKDPSMILEATPQTKEAAEAITVDKVIVFGLNFHIVFGYVRVTINFLELPLTLRICHLPNVHFLDF